MMQFFVVPVVVATIVLGIYKLFELFVCRRERVMLIERLQDVDPQVLSNFSYGMKVNFSFSALKWACLLMGIGLGIIIAFFLCLWVIPEFESKTWFGSDALPSIVFGGCMLLMGGLGLLVAFVVELHLQKEMRQNGD